MLQLSRKLPSDVLQGCYSATETMLHRAVRRLRVAGMRPVHRPLEARPISRQASWIRPGRQHRLVSNPAVCLRQRDQNVPGGRCLKRRGSKNQTSMAMPAMAAPTQQAAVRTGG